MKKIHIMLCLALGILVSGCFTSYVSTKQMMGIYPVSYTHLTNRENHWGGEFPHPIFVVSD